MMHCQELWMTLFGTIEWLGLNIGFWSAMAVVEVIVIIMNIVFWKMKPKKINTIQIRQSATVQYPCEYWTVALFCFLCCIISDEPSVPGSILPMIRKFLVILSCP